MTIARLPPGTRFDIEANGPDGACRALILSNSMPTLYCRQSADGADNPPSKDAPTELNEVAWRLPHGIWTSRYFDFLTMSCEPRSGDRILQQRISDNARHRFEVTG